MLERVTALLSRLSSRLGLRQPPADAELYKFKLAYARALTEQEQLRQRLQAQLEAQKAYGISEVAQEVLEVSDNLRRAVQSAPPPETLTDLETAKQAYAGLVEGLWMTHAQFRRILTKNPK